MPAVSKKQQRFMGMVHALNKGEIKPSDVSIDVQDVAKDLKKKDAKDFASTKHKGLPVKKEVLNKLKEMIRQELSEYTYGTGDVVKDVNPSCPHYGAMGKVKSVNPRSVIFIVKNKGKNFKPGMELEKSHDQMKKMNEVTTRTDKSIGTKNYKGVGWFWPSALWKHYLRDTSDKGRKEVHDAWLKAGFEVKKDNRGIPGFDIKPSQKNKAMKIVDAIEKRIPIKESVNESKKEKDQIIKYLQGLGFDERTAKNGVAKSYNYISKAYRNTGTRYKGDLIARILNKKESVNEADARNDKSIGTKNYKGVGWFWPSDSWKHYLRDTSDKGRKLVHDLWLKAGFEIKKNNRGIPGFDIKSNERNKAMKIVDMINKKMPIEESMNPRAVKKMRDEFEKTGQLPPHLKRFALDLKILKKKHKVKNIVVPGLEWMSDMKENINEDGHTDVPSAVRKLKTSIEDASQLLNKLNGMNKEDSLPSWWSDKITLSQNYLEKATNYLLNPVESVNESKKEKDQIIRYLQGLGFDERTAKKAVAKSYNYISKAYRNTGTQYKGDLIANILNKKESVNESRDFEKLYKFFSKKDYFGLKRVMKTQLGNYKRALKKGDKGAQKYSEKDVINSVNRMIKNRAKFTYDELKKAIKKKDIKALKSKLRYDQPYSLAIFNQITGKKLPKNTRDIHSFLDNQFMKESVFAVRQDKIKNGERFPKKPNFNYDPEKGKSRIRKVNETMKPSAIKKMRAEFERTGELPPHLKKFVKDVNILKKKHKVKNIVVPGLEWMSDMKEQSVNEARLNPKETIQQLGGNRFLYMVGAKNLAVDKPRNELHMKIMRNAKGVSHVVVRLTSLDLYDMKFLSIRAGKIRVKATEKGVYGDRLATFFKKHTGLNTRL